MGRKKTRIAFILGGVLSALLLLFLIVRFWMPSVPIVWRELPDHPKAGVWYRISPPGALDSTGGSWHGLFRLGTENRVLISFMGGGFSIDQNSAQQDEDFYYHRSNHDDYVTMGITNQDDRNPFRNWTMIVLPYSTADFHIGNGDFPYTDKNGRSAILHHSGYLNYRLMMDTACSKIGKPDTVLISGWSAGGFAAAMLADSILGEYFPEVERSAVLVDSAALSGDWPSIASDVWQAPPDIVNILHGTNMTLDSLQHLSMVHPETTILFSCSCRDAILSRYQNYLMGGAFTATEDSKQLFRSQLRETVDGVLALDNSGVFIWNDHPDNPWSMTGHISVGKRFYAETFDGTTIAQWVSDGVNGTVRNHGLELLDP